MRHPIRSAVVVGTSALLLASGAGTAAAQGSLESALPFPVDIPGLSSLAAEAGLIPGGPAVGPAGTRAEFSPSDLAPAELKAMAFEGAVVAAVNEARLAVGADRLVTDPAMEASARERAAALAEGDPTTGELSVPEDATTGADDAEGAAAVKTSDLTDRTVLTLPKGATPQNALTALLSDTGMRERMLSGEFTRVGVGVATAADGTVHLVQDFLRR
ncbi:CAP domain-containing protein [Dietzia alimentaria]|uniref:CAP domain-containing protein n=1 Tax=Dietzia alimentaria TaxID=665550 RepID=UPI00029A8AF8|nr:CAP domain-containing protein [Dietzia alimentaria]